MSANACAKAWLNRVCLLLGCHECRLIFFLGRTPEEIKACGHCFGPIIEVLRDIESSSPIHRGHLSQWRHTLSTAGHKTLNLLTPPHPRHLQVATACVHGTAEFTQNEGSDLIGNVPGTLDQQSTPDSDHIAIVLSLT